MEKYWICLLLLSLAAVYAQQDDDSYDLYDEDTILDFAKLEEGNHVEDGPSPDEQKWNKEEWQDYEDYPLYDSPLVDEGADLNDKIDDKPAEDKNVKEEFDQIEDNRSEQNADASYEEKDTDDANSFEEQSKSIETENSEEIPEENDGKNVDTAAAKEPTQNDDDNVEVAAEEKEDDDGDSSVYMDEQLDALDVPVAKEAVNSGEEKEENIAIEDVKGEDEENDDNNDNDDLNDDNDETVNKYAEEAAKDILELSKGDLIDGDSVDQVYDDLNKDLDKLMATWKKMNDGNEDYVEPEKNADDAIDPDEISEYEDKYGVPYGEKYVLSLREQNYDEADNEEKMSDEVEDSKEENADQLQAENIDEIEKKNEDVKETDVKNNDDDDGLFKDDPEADDATSEELDTNEGDDDDNETVDAKDDTLIEAGDDGILDNDADAADELLAPKKTQSTTETQSTIQSTDAATEKAPTTIDVSNLTSEEYDQLMRQFVKEHADTFDLTKSDVGKYVAPVHITLTQEPLTVTSPNFPSPYPTNNIIDWVFTGEGVGIELIITDFYVNGIMGDYLLVVPGGIDDSSKDGLVFSHMLNEPRRYRFLDVDTMFVRFQAFPGFSFRQGFSFTVRMVSPLPGESADESNENLPEPEAQLPAPVESFTVLIGGLTLPQFNESLEQFRLLVADMATMYINANGVDPGLNTTRDVTQITKVSVCNLNWPNSDMCSEVSFSVPLVYEEEEEQKPRLTEGELRAMWYLYSERDPFALRLRQMGMEEFTSPNDSGVLTVWLVIGFGLLISMAMLAFALWRFSCFENYARMPTYSDRDSVYSKQGLDLYPTPHQTLPPLFADSEYKWDDAKFDDSSRVDMGGFSNKSYIRDELLDMDSDEEVITPTKRDRFTTDV